MTYEPKVNDYVVWTTALGMKHEGWVYFVADRSEPKRGWSQTNDKVEEILNVKQD